MKIDFHCVLMGSKCDGVVVTWSRCLPELEATHFEEVVHHSTDVAVVFLRASNS